MWHKLQHGKKRYSFQNLFQYSLIFISIHIYGHIDAYKQVYNSNPQLILDTMSKKHYFEKIAFENNLFAIFAKDP